MDKTRGQGKRNNINKITIFVQESIFSSGSCILFYFPSFPFFFPAGIDLFKVNSRLHWGRSATDYTTCSGVSVVDFEQVSPGWVYAPLRISFNIERITFWVRFFFIVQEIIWKSWTRSGNCYKGHLQNKTWKYNIQLINRRKITLFSLGYEKVASDICTLN